MICSHIVKVLMTKEQYDFVKKEAQTKGKSLSSYMKEKALKQDYLIEKMIIELYRKVVENGK